MRYFIELSYNGKNYHGWQKQPNAISVQESIEQALLIFIGKKISVMGCGRTDSGVHASQFFLHFDVNQKIEEHKLKYKLNIYLQKDIAIHDLFLVADKSHARFDAVSRSYEYRMHIGKAPFLLDVVWRVSEQYHNIKKMNEAAKILYEYKNFKCFSKSNTDVRTNNCFITNAEWIRDGNHLTFYITSNRFLRNMVRAIVGTLLDVGIGKTSIDDFRKIIEGKDRTQAGPSVKAKGLFLTQVVYPEEILKNRNER